jgi:tRNA threonylcarbamoyladenosine biosynthesis protein TsaB
MLLALETAAEVGGAALINRGRVRAEITLGPGTSYNAALLPAIDRALEACAASLDEVSEIALSVGPGSFTGLRVGLATALGLCFGTDRRIVPVPTLAALSLHAGECPRIAPMLDARKGQVYAGLYGPSATVLLEDCVADPLPWLESLRGRGEIYFLGPGAELYRNEIETVLGSEARLIAGPSGWPRAATVGCLGERLRAQGAARIPQEVELRYLRKAEAEEKRAGVVGGHTPGERII